MMEQNEAQTIERSIGDLKIYLAEKFTKLETGQEHTNNHLATLNSKVAAHEKRLNENDILEAIKKAKDEEKEKAVADRRVLPGWITVILTIFTFLVGYYLTH